MGEQEPWVCMLPYKYPLGWRASAVPLTDLHWPLGRPEGLEGKTLADLTERDHLLTPPRSRLFFQPSLGTRAQVSVVLLEPRAIHAKYMRFLGRFSRWFHRVLTADDELLGQIPNGVFFPIGGCWVPEWDRIDQTKEKMCSLIASAKKDLPGHKLRHEMARWSRVAGQDVDIMGRGYRPFAAKAEGLAPYRYSLVIENAQEKNYFTEKLIDALLLKTVPIYWGCPNIADFFDVRGMILCRTEAEMKAAVAAMSVADYEARADALAANQIAATRYGDPMDRAAHAIRADAHQGGRS
jgi:hypothetical protein